MRCTWLRDTMRQLKGSSKKSLLPGDFPRRLKIVGPGHKKTVTKHAKYSIRAHQAARYGEKYQRCHVRLSDSTSSFLSSKRRNS